MAFDAPILFLVFNRPDTTRLVFQRIREIQPAKLFIGADGPRAAKEGEKEKCEEVRNIILKGIDWPCDVKTLFRDSNLGCGLAVSEAITWFFEHVEEGIILEDDTLPGRSFFVFCKEMLIRYRNELSIWHIGGICYYNKENKYSYYFSAYPHIWGWATWRRAWKNYQFELTVGEIHQLSEKIANMFLTNAEKNFWIDFFKRYASEPLKSTWDYQWTFRMWYNKGLAILPTTNLVKNIGFGENATHTTGGSSWLPDLQINEFNEIRIRPIIQQNKKADLYTSKKVFHIKSRARMFLSKVKAGIRSF